MSKIDKNNFRKLCLNKLQFYSKNAKIKKDKDICVKIINIIEEYEPKKILLYIPLKNEVNIKDIINKLRKKRNIEVYVPYIKGNSFIPVKYRLPLQKRKFNVQEPNFSRYRDNKIDFDLIVVPIIGIDGFLKRVGFGAGMYDRFFSTLKKRPITIFTQLKLCTTKEIITNDYDIQADYIIT
jgi:5-formyltetrahydrofolate cyclo-ligase